MARAAIGFAHRGHVRPVRPRRLPACASSRAYPSFTPTSMPEESIPSRASKLSTRDTATSRVRPSPRSSKVIVSRATASGMPSQVKVCTSRSSRTVWKQPWKPYSSPSATLR